MGRSVGGIKMIHKYEDIDGRTDIPHHFALATSLKVLSFRNRGAKNLAVVLVLVLDHTFLPLMRT